MSEWCEVAVEDIAAKSKSALATGPFGSAVSKKHFVDDGIPMIRGSNLSTDVGTRLIDDGMVFLAPDVASRFERSTVRSGDLVFTCWGTIGQIGLIDDMCRFDRYIVSNKQMKLTPNPELADGRFLYYALSSPQNLDQVQRQAIGSAVPGFNLGQLRQIRIFLPDLDTQRSIAAVLQRIDDLIENNRRRIEVLEEMAQAIYREWFIHFRYPGHEDATFVDSPLGPIPEVCAALPLYKIADLTMGQSPKSEFYNDLGNGSPFHQGVKDFGPHFPTHRTFCTVAGRAAGEGDVLISVRAPVGRLNIAPTDMTIGRGLAAARSTDDHQSLLFYALKLSAFSVEDSMGSGTIFKAITKKDLHGLTMLWPSPQLADQGETTLAPMIGQIRMLSESATRLSSIRDLLLPRLVTGEIDVSELDLDALVEAAS